MDFITQWRRLRRRRLGLLAAAMLVACGILAWIFPLFTACILLWLGCASLLKARQLRSGGAAVAVLLGGTPVNRRGGGELEHRLVDVANELARAAVIPLPQLFVLRKESAVNAFVAGHGPQDAAIGVSVGALQRFSAEELTAVLGHELAHLKNGSALLDLRLLVVCHGLFVLTNIARRLRAHAASVAKQPQSMIYGALAAALTVVGLPALAVGRSLQAVVSRFRVRLGDAPSAPYVAQPAALRSALSKIVGGNEGGVLKAAAETSATHIFFVPADESRLTRLGARIFATHPPILQRVRKIGSRLRPEAERNGTADPAAPSPKSIQVPSGALPFFTNKAERISLESLQRRLPDEQQAAIAAVELHYQKNAKHVRALFIAALLPEQLDARRLALEYLARICGPGMLRAATVASKQLLGLPAIAHLPLLVGQLAALDGLAVVQRSRFLQTIQYLTRELGNATMLRYCLRRLLVQGVGETAHNPSSATHKLTDCAASLGQLFCVLAAVGNADRDQAGKAFAVGIDSLLKASLRPAFRVLNDDWPESLDVALDELSGLHPPAREALVEAMAATVAHDGLLTAAEAELLRTICLVIGTAAPALSVGSPLPAGALAEAAAAGLR